MIFSSFKCRGVAHEETKTIIVNVLASSPEVICYESDAHRSAVALAIVFLCLYVVGLPVVMFVLLNANRAHLHNTDSPKHALVKHALGTLYLPYERPYFWFEIVNMAAKMLM